MMVQYNERQKLPTVGTVPKFNRQSVATEVATIPPVTEAATIPPVTEGSIGLKVL
jgi:hypothetical protein